MASWLLRWPVLAALILGLCSACRAQDQQGASTAPAETTTLLVGTAPPYESGEPEGPSLGFILGVATIIVTIIYIIGITYKIYKIFNGEYEPSEPIYLKYK